LIIKKRKEELKEKYSSKKERDLGNLELPVLPLTYRG
jgi:hypothetical protein